LSIGSNWRLLRVQQIKDKTKIKYYKEEQEKQEASKNGKKGMG
jgi:hypothetical protein